MTQKERQYRESRIKRLKEEICDFKERNKRIGTDFFDTDINYCKKRIKDYENPDYFIDLSTDSFTVLL